MKAFRCHAFDDPPILHIDDIPIPEPRAGEMLVAVAAVGLGFVDALLCAGKYQMKPQLPYVPGNEIAGRVIALGPETEGFKVGDRVAGLAAGGLAQYARLSCRTAIRLPDAIAMETAAACLTNYQTVWHGLVERASARVGEVMLVLGAGGGLGLAAIDLGGALGLRVLALGSSPGKREAALAQGAEAAFDSSRPDWRAAIEHHAGRGGIDIVFDPVGGSSSEIAFRTLAPGGRHLVLGFASGEIPRIPLNLPLLKRAEIVGVDWGGDMRANPEHFHGQAAPVQELLVSGTLRPAGIRVIPPNEVSRTMHELVSRQWQGKPVVIVSW